MSEGRRILLGENPLNPESGQIRGEMVELEGERYYRISHYDRMAPFFMTLVSDSDHWMFLSSRGGLSCGRINPENALFPYYTDDKIHDASTHSGPLTILLIEAEKRTYLWEPFQMLSPDVYRVQRNLYKNGTGNKLIFEAINQTLQVCFRYVWQNSDRYGFVRQSFLSNLSDEEIRVELVDGIRNILPYGVNRMLQSNMSTLVDGYKKCELHSTTGLGIYTLSSILTDRAEPSEALKATTVWSAGLEHPRYLLSEDQADAFRKGMVPECETILKGRRGAYLVYDSIPLHPGEIREWIIVAEINQDPSDVPALIRELESTDMIKAVMEDVGRGTRQLGHLVGLADGIQCSGNAMKSARHFSNTLFNIMRGGIFPDGYDVRLRDFLDFMEKWNRPVFLRHHASLSALSDESIHYHDLLAFSEKQDDPDLVRLVSEYLPLTFSRRHGDPSRPWNSFSIEVKNEKGDLNFNYQGNWRDIFQNWEALALSFPGFIESFITKFVNASTMDKNLGFFKEKGFKEIVTTCAGCYRTFKDLYPKYRTAEGIPVYHIVEYLEKLIQDRRLTFKNGDKKTKVAYHDPCDIGRHINIYDPPRNVLKALPSVELVEFPLNRNLAKCCGSGGGMKAFDTDMSLEIAFETDQQAGNIGAEVVVSACPACKSNLNLAAARLRKEKKGRLKVMDITELVADAFGVTIKRIAQSA